METDQPIRDVEQVIQRIVDMRPAATVRQLAVRHSGADDEGIWFLQQPACSFEVQIESPNGMCPFLIETEETGVRFTTASIEETVQTLTNLFHLAN